MIRRWEVDFAASIREEFRYLSALDNRTPRTQNRLDALKDLLDQQRIVAVHHVGRPVADLQHGERHAIDSDVPYFEARTWRNVN